MNLELLSEKTYKTRRDLLAQSVNGGKILFLGNRESSVNFRDNWYPFRQDSTFLYYAGLNIANLDLVIDADTGETTLYGDELTLNDIIWTGPLPSLRELASRVGIEHVRPSSELSDEMNGPLHFLPPYRPLHEMRLRGQGEPSEELIEAVVAQRNKKSTEEIESLHEACTLTSRMHFEVMSSARKGMHEYELVAIAEAYGRRQNTSLSFLPICTTRGHVLHNHTYDNVLNEGEMLLFDGGLESKLLYAGDMTRTFPVGGTFSSMQAEIYQVVLNAHKAGSSHSNVGARFLDVHLAAAKTITEGLTELGFMKGDPDEAVAAGAHTLFFQHGLGHVMGLDVHDMENLGEQHVGYGGGMVKSKEFGLRSLRLGRELEAGFVVTIEPGIYLIPELIDQFKAEGKYTDFINYDAVEKIRNLGGIRIEDDFLISDEGAKLLGEPLVREISEIEAVRGD